MTARPAPFYLNNATGKENTHCQPFYCSCPPAPRTQLLLVCTPWIVQARLGFRKFVMQRLLVTRLNNHIVGWELL